MESVFIIAAGVLLGVLPVGLFVTGMACVRAGQRRASYVHWAAAASIVILVFLGNIDLASHYAPPEDIQILLDKYAPE